MKMIFLQEGKYRVERMQRRREVLLRRVHDSSPFNMVEAQEAKNSVLFRDGRQFHCFKGDLNPFS